MKINQNYDKDVDAVYLKFSDNKIYKTKEVKTGIMVDFDWRGYVVGVEVLDAARRKFRFAIIKTSKHRPQKVEVSAGRQKINLPIPVSA